MAVSTDGQIALSAAGQLHGMAGLAGKSWREVKFCNGEMMGKKLKMTQPHRRTCSNRSAGKHVYMSLTTEIPLDAKVRSFNTNSISVSCY